MPWAQADFTSIGQLEVLPQGSSPQELQNCPGRKEVPVLQTGKLRIKNVQNSPKVTETVWLQDFPLLYDIRHAGLQAQRLNLENQPNPRLLGSAISCSLPNIVSITSVVIL